MLIMKEKLLSIDTYYNNYLGRKNRKITKKITFYDKGEITSAVMVEVKNHDLGYLPLVITFKLLSSLWAKIKMRTTHGL
jgi:hypothetical protein